MPAYLLLLVFAADASVYERDIKPLLRERCWSCHGALQQQGGLRLDTAALARRGGDQGAALIPGDAANSLLLHRVSAPDLAERMPPEGEPLTATQLASLQRWIEAGAPAPEDEAPEPDPGEHWSFRPPKTAPWPDAEDPAWPRDPFDLRVADGHRQHGLKPQLPADRRTWLRRIYLDLIGLPPTLAQQEAFLADTRPDAQERVTDQLLAAPQHGERWGRHWMDIWRYSDWWGLGAEVRNSQKHIWHWRDWIVESLNQNLGYDEMLRQMLAADELYPNDLEKLRATGYLARQYFKFNRNTWLDDTVEHTSKAFLGLTLNCAKCHDHKYDPWLQTDYYQFRAIFEPYQVRLEQVPGEADYERDGIPRAFDCNLDTPTYLFERGDEKQPVKEQPLAPQVPALLASLTSELQIEPLELPRTASQPGLRPFVLHNALVKADAELAAARAQAFLPALKTALAQASSLRARAAADRAAAGAPPDPQAEALATAAAQAERDLAVAQAEDAFARAQLEQEAAGDDPAKRDVAAKKLGEAQTKLDELRAKVAGNEPLPAYTPLRGANKTVESPTETEAQRLRPFPTTSSGRRRALALWLTAPENPLTARVAANHLWARHFGQPLVATVFDLGRKGARPSHPELLDDLAIALVRGNWDMKRLHRRLVLTATYEMSSSGLQAGENLSRDGENRYLWRMPSVRVEAQVVRDSLLHLAAELDLQQGGPSISLQEAETSPRRSLYFVHSHNDHERFLSAFDDANVQECYRRAESIVPQQALALSNGRVVWLAAETLAARLRPPETLAASPAAAHFVREAFRTVLAMEPSEAELAACEQALPQLQPVGLIHALFNHNDFVTRR